MNECADFYNSSFVRKSSFWWRPHLRSKNGNFVFLTIFLNILGFKFGKNCASIAEFEYVKLHQYYFKIVVLSCYSSLFLSYSDASTNLICRLMRVKMSDISNKVYLHDIKELPNHSYYNTPGRVNLWHVCSNWHVRQFFRYAKKIWIW